MTRFLSSLAARARRHSAGSHYGRAYVFLVVALAVFLLGVACWRRPVTGYTARAVLVQRSPANEKSPNPEQLQAQLTAEILAPQAIQSIAKSTGLVDSPNNAEALRERTKIQVAGEPKSGTTRIVLWHVGASDAQAVAVAQQLAEHYALAHSQQAASRARCAQCDAAQASVHSAAAAKESAKAAVESFRQQHVDELGPSPARKRAASAPATVESARSATAAVEPQNPAWKSLSDQLEVLEAALAQLLQRRTPEHPEVLDMVSQIEQVKAQLSTTPRALAAERPAAATPAAAKPETSEVDPQVALKFSKLNAAYDLATRRHEEALVAERAAWQNRWSQPTEQIAIVEPAHVVARQGGGPSKSGVLFVSLLAITAGGAIAWRSQLITRPAALTNAAQVEQFGLPVIAVLATRDGPPIAQPQLSNPPWIRYVALGCELLLTAIIVLLAVVVLADWQIAAQAIWDPLSAFSDALWRLTP